LQNVSRVQLATLSEVESDTKLTADQKSLAKSLKKKLVQPLLLGDDPILVVAGKELAADRDERSGERGAVGGEDPGAP